MSMRYRIWLFGVCANCCLRIGTAEAPLTDKPSFLSTANFFKSLLTASYHWPALTHPVDNLRYSLLFSLNQRWYNSDIVDAYLGRCPMSGGQSVVHREGPEDTGFSATEKNSQKFMWAGALTWSTWEYARKPEVRRLQWEETEHVVICVLCRS